jgi:DNA-binding transcriptional regulator GbsR (MarR family)
MVEAGGRTAESFGFNRLLGQIYTLLYLTPEMLSLDALAERMQVSKASCSIACRQLASWGAVRCIRKAGDRRDYYEAETDLGTLLAGGLLPSLNKKLESAKVQIERSLRLLESQPGGDDHVGFVRRRLKEAEQRRARLARLINHPLLRRML